MNTQRVSVFPGLRLDRDAVGLGLEGAVIARDLEWEAGAIGARAAIDRAATSNSVWTTPASNKSIDGMGIHTLTDLAPEVTAQYELAVISVYNGGASAGSRSLMWGYDRDVGVVGSDVLVESNLDLTVTRTSDSSRGLSTCVYAYPTDTVVVCVPTSGSDALRAYGRATNWSVLNATSRDYRAVCAWGAAGNRLCAAYGTRVIFSDPGAPSTWGANNYIDVGPGDGDSIRAMFELGDGVVVLKGRMGAYIYGQSTAADGTPVFQWRTFEVSSPPLGANAWERTPFGTLVACRDGIYRIAPEGMARWEPGNALGRAYPSGRRQLGDAMLGEWEVGTAGAQSTTAIGKTMVYAQDRLFVAPGWVWDARNDAWSRWYLDLEAAGHGVFFAGASVQGSVAGYVQCASPYRHLAVTDLVPNGAGTADGEDELPGATAIPVVGRYASGLFSGEGGEDRVRARRAFVEARMNTGTGSGYVNFRYRNEDGDWTSVVLPASTGDAQAVPAATAGEVLRLAFPKAGAGRWLGYELALSRTSVRSLTFELVEGSRR